MAKRKGHWVFVHWKRVQAKGSGAGQWVWKRVWRRGSKPKPAPSPAPAPAPKPTKVYMYDDVNLLLVPKTARVVAGYVDGGFMTWLKLKLLFPLAKKVSISVFAKDNADVLDVEPRDATNAEAPGWVKRQRSRRKAGAKSATRLPVLYTSAANGERLIAACTKAGLVYGEDYLWWSAHYDPAKGEHFCGPSCGFGLTHTAHGTQFTDHADNKNLDESVLAPGFLA